MEHLALIRGPNKSILRPIIAADSDTLNSAINFAGSLSQRTDSLGTECLHRQRQNFIMIPECIPLPAAARRVAAYTPSRASGAKTHQLCKIKIQGHESRTRRYFRRIC
jgi:hypothetical protein